MTPDRISRIECAIGGPGGGLATDVHLPAGTGPWPVIVYRTPYGRSKLLAEGRAWARLGIVAVVQGIRGRYDSDGTFDPYRHEVADGAALRDWLTGQAWCDQRIVAMGSSYGGHCALSFAASGPLCALVLAVPAVDHERVAQEAGIARLLSQSTWWVTFAGCRTDRSSLFDTMTHDDPNLLNHLPLSSLPTRFGLTEGSWSRAWPRGADLCEVSLLTSSSAPPLLVIGGLHDVFLPEVVGLWEQWPTTARMLIGPWGHTLQPLVDDELAQNPSSAVRVGPVITQFVRAALSGSLTAESRSVVSTSDGHWHSFGNDWPTVIKRNSTFTDVAATWPAPWSLDADRCSFVADPTNPFPSRIGPSESAADPLRTDSIRLCGAPVINPVLVSGSPQVELSATDSIGDADWFVRFSERRPNGETRQLVTGISHHVGPAGVRQVVNVSLSPISHLLQTGSCIQLDIAGHHFPVHARNLHGDDRINGTRMRVAERSVQLDASKLVVHWSAVTDPALDTELESTEISKVLAT